MNEEIAIDDRHYYKQSGEWRLKAHASGAYDAYTNECCSPLLDEIKRLKGILRHVASNNPIWADPDMECRTCNEIIKEFGR